ncbi:MULTISPECIES: fimbria/pilus outer membrane usher protein [Burkholderia]|uniref:Outer membrane usher protein FimD/PapC n=1 Tax=Burkholderia pyrrocinia TaxID=60550 RepID=A0A318HZ88_BURPY|nr:MULTISPECIES: fimbria/pilus outer membrane usher protein [Burkholderia]PXX22050.1 outer membrane usher protein FimD/PapC [Burkholderia pyrrocinia]SFW90051.1 Outer membrane usher protein FimD/PapC [Burkholderia sp. NFACC33-1]SFY46392.1 Outer membrane usher protein FimD/PapC [Burkholderia sp. NFPP32]
MSDIRFDHQPRLPALTRCATLVVAAFGAIGSVDAAESTFDPDVLRARGIDPAIAERFKSSARFIGANTPIDLVVNGRKIGRVNATFDDDGRLCMDTAFLQSAHLKPVDTASDAGAADMAAETARAVSPACRAFVDAYPTTIVRLNPAQQTVDIVTPPEAQAAREVQSREFGQHGAAGILNYRMLTTHNRYASGSSQFVQASTEAGFNYNGWIVRSQDYFSARNGTQQWDHLTAYAQRTFDRYGSVVQFGQINTQGEIVGGVPLDGIQLFPEQALAPQTTGQSLIQGIANSQARVEIRQNGILIHSTVVPPGPFTLSDVQLTSTTRDVTVTVIETDNSQHQFVVPAAALQQVNIEPPTGPSFAIGKVRGIEGDTDGQIWLASATYGLSLGKQANLTGAATLSNGYRAVGSRIDTLPWSGASFSAQVTGADDRRVGERGIQTMMLGSVQLPWNFSLNASETRRTPGYRDVLETIGRPSGPGNPAVDDGPWLDTRAQLQRSLGMSWSNPKFGAIGVSYSSSSTFSGSDSKRLFVSWGRQFGPVSLSVSLDRDMGSSEQSRTGTNVFTTATFPLGRNSNSLYASRAGKRQSFGVRTSAAINDYSNYSLSAGYDDRSKQPAFSGSLNATPRYTQLAFSSSVSGSSSSFSAQASGGAVLHRHGVTFSPYPVRDTFGIIRVGDLSGVGLSTPAGRVWTDGAGRAVIASLPAYSTGRIEVATKTLARNVDLVNGYQPVTSGRGGVSNVAFDVVKVRRALLTARDDNGGHLPRGASVNDEDGNFVTLVGDDGAIFLPDVGIDTPPALIVRDAIGNECSLGFALPDKPDADAPYERADAQCRAVAAR